MAATDADFDKYLRPPKERPVSAPLTRDETDKAILSANETDRYVRKRTAPTVMSRPHIRAVIQQEDEIINNEESDTEGKGQTETWEGNVEQMQE